MTTMSEPKPKRIKPQSRGQRWADAIAEARKHLDDAVAARDLAMAAVADLKAIQDEYVDWRDNLPENLGNSPLGEKLESVTSIDLEPEEGDLEKIEEALSEAEAADLPLGFGRD